MCETEPVCISNSVCLSVCLDVDLFLASLCPFNQALPSKNHILCCFVSGVQQHCWGMIRRTASMSSKDLKLCLTDKITRATIHFGNVVSFEIRSCCCAGFVVGLPATQKHRQLRLMWLHVVAAYQLRCACRAHVQQHKHQQVSFLLKCSMHMSSN